MIESGHLMAILEAVAEGIQIHRLIDRDDMTEDERNRKICEDIRVLRRRELEEYLYDAEVIRTFLTSHGCDERIVANIIEAREELLANEAGPANVKHVSRKLFETIRSATKLPNLGNSREEFAFNFLVPALRGTQQVFDELWEDIFEPR